MNQPWRIEMLGGLRVCQAETVITRFKTHKTGALLAYLAFYSRRTHTREALIDMLWPEADLTQGRPSLSVALSSLRHQLEPPGTPPGSVLITTNTDIRLNTAACTTDVAEFEALLSAENATGTGAEEIARLTHAADLYRGELLPGHYEGWCSLERERLHGLYIQALRRLVRGLVRERALPQAITYAEKAAVADPLQEELHRDLMQLYAAAGQPSLALRQYREVEARWREELGARPSAATRKLAQEIAARLEQAPEMEETKTAALPKPPAPSAPAAPPLPAGMQTFLAAALVSSRKRAEWPDALLSLLRKQALAHGGQEAPGRTPGMWILAFARAADAQACALAIRHGLSHLGQEPAPALCLALHTGEADDDATRRHLAALLSAAHPGQVLCTEETALFLRRVREPGVRLCDLGRWRLPDDAEPVTLFEIAGQEASAAPFPPPRAASAHTPDLPMQFTRFFGRETELTRLRSLLTSEPRARLVTLTGPGGTGKTRLAIEAAHRLAEAWQGAVWFVSLAHVQEAGRIAEAILDALKLPHSAGTEPLARLRESLGRQPALLVLDNLEQVADGAAETIRALLEQIPGLSCLATSRQRLNLAAERELAVPPLPPPKGETRPEPLARCESVRLFVDRAQAVRLDFQITAHNAAAVAELCDRLEGLPLALELAAARAQALSPAQMLAQLEDRFAFLTSRRRDVPERHRMLRAAIDWSYRLLPPELQRFFAALAVFHGGWSLEAAETVCEEAAALDALCQLQECSLIVAEEPSSGTDLRFRMLQTLRAFGEEQWTDEERARQRERHAAYFAPFARLAETHLADAQQTAWLHRLDQDRENLRAALTYLLDAGRIREAAQMSVALSEYWERRGLLREAVAFLDRCLAALPPKDDPALRRRMLGSGGWFAYLQGRYAEARDWQERNLAECVAAQDDEGECIARNNLGLIAQVQGRLDEAAQHFERSLAIARQQGHAERQAARLSNLGLLAIQQERYAEARAALDEALAIYRAGQNAYGVAACLCNIAKLALYQAGYAEAQALAGESLRLFQEAGDRSGMAYALANLGLAKTLHGDSEGAACDLRQALDICRATGLYSLTPVLLETWARNDAARSRLPSAVFALAAAGRLRSELRTPRNAFEEQTIAGLQEQFDAACPQAELRQERAQAAALPLEQLLTRILDTFSGDTE